MMDDGAAKERMAVTTKIHGYCMSVRKYCRGSVVTDARRLSGVERRSSSSKCFVPTSSTRKVLFLDVVAQDLHQPATMKKEVATGYELEKVVTH